MSVTSLPHRVLRFGVFEVDLRTAELRKYGVRIRLEEQPFQILSLLLESPGELVTREELRQRLWSADIFVDFDHALNKAISKLRLALGDSAENPRFIETLPRRGYRFITAVQSHDIPAISTPSEPEVKIQIPTPSTEGVRKGIRLVRSTRAIVAAIVILVLTIPFVLRRRQAAAAGSPAVTGTVVSRRSVAVLGFKNLSGRDEQAWISTALSDWLTTELSAGEQLRMIPGENIARMKIELSVPETESLGTATLARIGNNLGTDLVVVGSYANLGSKGSGTLVRLDVRLQDTRSGETLYAISETGTEAHLFDLVSQAGEHLRTRLGVNAMTRTEAAEVAVSLPTSHDAARFYSEGLDKLRVFDALTARDLFQKAITIDPSFALSHAALAKAWGALGYEENAQSEAKKAYDLSAKLPRAERLLVEGRFYEASTNWPKAIEVYRALFAFFPDSLDYGLALAHAQVSSGSGKDALDTVEALKKLPSPLGDDPRIDLAEAGGAESLGDFKRDLVASKRAAEKARKSGASLLLAQADADSAWALDNLGPLDEAIAVAKEAQRLFSVAGDKRGMAQASTVGAIALGLQGDTWAAKKVYEEGLAIYRAMGDKKGMAVELNNIADQQLSLGDPAGALHQFEQSLQINEEIGHQDGVAMAKSNLGGVLLELGNSAAAKHMYEDSLEVCRKIGDRSKAAGDLAGLGTVMLVAGQLDQARNYLYEAISEFQQIGDNSSAAEVEVTLAEVLNDQGKPLDSALLARKASDEFERENSPRDESLANSVLARALLAAGDISAAQKIVRSTLALSGKYRDRQTELSVEVSAARVRAAAASETERAQVMSHLQQVLTDATRHGFVNRSLEARLALGEMEIVLNKSTALKNLEGLRDDANNKGFRLIAQQASAVLNQATLHR